MSESGQRIEFVNNPVTMTSSPAVEATSSVAYRSDGHLLLIAPVDTAAALLPRLELPRVSVVTVDPAVRGVERRLSDSGTTFLRCASLVIDGHLGAFSAIAGSADGPVDLAQRLGGDTAHFDLVLDLSPQPLVSVRLPPFGYFAAPDGAELDAALLALAEHVGEFEKPRYFDYRATLCAHSRSGLTGCSNCLDVCVTGAISPQGEGIEVDPFLCQGCGSCATVCPSGAMTYAYPKPADAIAESRRLVQSRGARVLLLHTEADQPLIDALPAASVLLPLVVEEVAAYGMDYWASMVCAGVHRILLLAGDNPDDPNRQALALQSSLFHTLLQGLGVSEAVVELLQRPALDELAAELTAAAAGKGAADLPAGADTARSSADPGEGTASAPAVYTPAAAGQAPDGAADTADGASRQADPERNPRRLLGVNAALAGLQPKNFLTYNDKRQTIRSAFDSLSTQLQAADTPRTTASCPVAVQELPPTAAFGRINVDPAACTLCMGCVSTCPAGALLDGQDTPALRMIEANCLQCGLCATACPEQAITLEPRYLYDSLQARKVVTLNAAEPFHCISCHKPFATRAIIDKMAAKLSGHWMFSDEKARRRLKMCEDCRVKDIFADDTPAIDVHRERS